jgi:hypothetical protein
VYEQGESKFADCPVGNIASTAEREKGNFKGI